MNNTENNNNILMIVKKHSIFLLLFIIILYVYNVLDKNLEIFASSSNIQNTNNYHLNQDQLRKAIESFNLKQNDNNNSYNANTIKHHVDKSYEWLEQNLKNNKIRLKNKSSFPSYDIAEKTIKDAMLANIDKIDAWLIGSNKECYLSQKSSNGRRKKYDNVENITEPKVQDINKNHDYKINKKTDVAKKIEKNELVKVQNKSDEFSDTKNQSSISNDKTNDKNDFRKRKNYNRKCKVLKIKYKSKTNNIGYGVIRDIIDENISKNPNVKKYQSQTIIVVLKHKELDDKNVLQSGELPFFVANSYPIAEKDDLKITKSKIKNK